MAQSVRSAIRFRALQFRSKVQWRVFKLFIMVIIIYFLGSLAQKFLSPSSGSRRPNWKELDLFEDAEDDRLKDENVSFDIVKILSDPDFEDEALPDEIPPEDSITLKPPPAKPEDKHEDVEVDDTLKEILEFESKFVPGLGANGDPCQITDVDEANKQVSKYGFNKALSDQIGVRRTLRDLRDEKCHDKVFDQDLPKASVIIIFNNEMMSTLLRNVWSILDQSGEHLHEIILVDDGSTYDEIKTFLPLYIKHRLPANVILHVEPKQIGLIRAKMSGARLAKGEVLIFLDSHCEVAPGWIQPMLQRIKDNPTSFILPLVDIIEPRDMSYYGGGWGPEVNVGGFTWAGYFFWRTGKSGKTPNDPVATPTMPGGLFAVNRNYFFHLGAYDESMHGWGGENLEMSFRVWRCGGVIEQLACSRVGHMTKTARPYLNPEDSHGINAARMAEVWMDEFKKYFYMYRQDLDQSLENPAVIGDLTERIEKKNSLNCKSFQWYLDNVYPEKFQMEKQSIKHGRVRNKKRSNICLEHELHVYHTEECMLKVHSCDSFLMKQWLSFSHLKELRHEFMCGEPYDTGSTHYGVKMYTCDVHGDEKEKQIWELTSDGAIRNVKFDWCLTLDDDTEMDQEIALKKCDGSEEQQWVFDSDSN